MNPYFWLLAFGALASLRVTVELDVQLARKSAYHMRLRAGGVPIRQQLLRLINGRRRLKLEQQGVLYETSREIDPLHSRIDPRMLRLLMDGRVWLAAKRCVDLASLELTINVAFHDAARTALVFQTLQCLLNTLRTCRMRSERVHTRIRGEFSGHGASVHARGILSAKVGNLLIAAVIVGRQWLAVKKTAASKEKTYAASH